MNDKELDSKENYEKSRKSEKIKLSNDGHNALISSIISQSVDSSGDTPQTKRQKDIRKLLKKIDCKLNFLDLNEQADFHKFYRHKNIILSEIRNNSDEAKLSDLLELIRQAEVYDFYEWHSKKTAAE